MERMACVNLPAFPLQLLLRRHPEWRKQPAAVVDQDRAQGVLLWVNEAARASGILPGMRYTAGLSLHRGLCAHTVEPEEIHRALLAVYRLLHQHGPDVECAPDEPGAFFLRLSGMDWNRLPPEAWGEAVRRSLRARGFAVRVALGFHRFPCYAASLCGPALRVFASPAEENHCLHRTPLARLGLSPELRDALDKLGIRRLGDFLGLPPGSLRHRFGAEAARLHQLANGESTPFCAAPPPAPPLEVRLEFDYGEQDIERLLHRLEPQLGGLLRSLGKRQEAMAELHLRLHLEDRSRLDSRLRPAAPSLDVNAVLTLLRLRLERTEFPAAISAVRLRLRGVPASAAQLELWRQRARRSLEDAEQAFAELRAEFGNGILRLARLKDAHLPEESFQWEPLERLKPAHPPPLPRALLIRRLRTHPLPIPPPFDFSHPPPETLGPYPLSGGWWERPVERAYFYLPGPPGAWRWVYFEPRSGRWFEHGRVE